MKLSNSCKPCDFANRPIRDALPADERDTDIFDDPLLAARLAPIIACGIMIWWLNG